MTTEIETQPALFDFLKITNFGRKKKPGPDKKYATFNRRMLAAMLDSLLLMIFTTPLINRVAPVKDVMADKYILDGSDPMALRRWLLHIFTDREFITSWITNFTAQMLVICLFSAVCWHFWSATPGKMLLRIKIVDAKTEQPITDKQILLRNCGYFISALFLFFGFFWIGFDRRRQGWHDKIADTLVIVLPWKGFESWFS